MLEERLGGEREEEGGLRAAVLPGAAAQGRRQDRQLIDLMPQIVVLSDGDGVMQCSNRAFRQFAGMQGDGIDDWQGAISGDDAARLRAAFAAEAAAPEPGRALQMRIRRADGEMVWHQFSFGRRLGPDGAVQAIYGVAADVSATRAALAAANGAVARERVARRDAEAVGARLRLLESALSRLSDMVVVTEGEPLDEPGPRIVFVNDAFENRTGYSRAEVLGRSPRMLQGPRTDRAALDRIRQAMLRNHPIRAEVVNYTRDGEAYWVEMDITPIFVGGRVTHRVAIERDVTDRKAEERLRQAGAQILELISSGYPLREALARIARIAQELSSARVSIMLADAGREKLVVGAAPDLPDSFADAVNGMAIGPRAGSCGTAIHRRDTVICCDVAADPLWTDFRDIAVRHAIAASWSIPVMDAQGEPFACLALYYDAPYQPDGAEIRRMTQVATLLGIAIERMRDREELQESERRFRSVVGVTADLVFDWNIAGDAVWWSEGIESLFGYSPRDVEPGPESWTNRLHIDDHDRVLKELHAFIGGGGETWQGAFRFRRADGTYAQVLARAMMIRDADGAALRMVGSFADVTEQKETDERLRQSQRLQAVGQLTGGIAHDFNNILTVMLGNSQVLMELLEPGGKAHRLAEMTKDAALRGAQLTDRLLAFARRQPLAPRPIDVDHLLARMDGLLRRTLGEHIEIAAIADPRRLHVLADEAQLESAIVNLCINARDAMPNGGRLTLVTASADVAASSLGQSEDLRPGSYVSISVADTGVGMSREVASKAFEPFFTTKGIERGSGLGLSMVYGFCKQSGGNVTIASEPGRGTTVTLYLPRSAPSRQPVRASGRRHGAEPRGTEHILLVEDDDLVRRHVAGQLADLGYRVSEARNGPEALEQLGTAPDVALLFTDVVMPGGMSGGNLARAVRKMRPDLPVLFTSGYTDNALLEGGRIETGVHLLKKPYQRRELAMRIRTVLDE